MIHYAETLIHLCILRLYNESILRSFPTTHRETDQTTSSSSPYFTARVYYCGPNESLRSICLSGFGPSSSSKRQGRGDLILSSDPVAAYHIASWFEREGGRNSSKSSSNNEDGGPCLSPMLVCRAHLRDVASCTIPWNGDYHSLSHVLQTGMAKFPAAASALRVIYDVDGRGDEDDEDGGNSSSTRFFLIVKSKCAHALLPEYHALCGDSQVSGWV